MNKYEFLLQEADDQDILVKEKDLNIFSGIYMDGDIFINKDLTNTEKTCIIAEELGHHHTCVSNIINQKQVLARKIELLGRDWAVKRLVSLTTIVEGLRKGCRSRYELAEEIGVTEELLDEAVKYYKRKYGSYVKVGEVYLLFEPSLGIYWDEF